MEKLGVFVEDIEKRLDQMKRSQVLCDNEGHNGASEYYKKEINRLQGILSQANQVN